MRTFYDGSGNDSSAMVRSYLATERRLLMADLYIIGTAPCYQGSYLDKTFMLTEHGSPLLWDYKGEFLPGVISRGEVDSKIGLEADTLDITWSPKDTDIVADDGSGNTLLTVLQAFRAGIFDNGTVQVWRCVMPLPGQSVGSPAITAKYGDANVFGASMMFGGRIGEVKPDRQSVTFTLVSRLETLNVQVPTNLIEPTNILAQYATGQIPSGGPASMGVATGTTVDKVYADDTASPPVTMDAGTYDGGYIRFTSGRLQGHYAGVRAQTIESGHHAFYLYGSLPFAPETSDTLTAYVPIPPDQASAGSSYLGWPYVPNPTNSSVVIA